MGSLLDGVALTAMLLGAGLLVWSNEVTRAITCRLSITRPGTRPAAQALCLIAGIAVATLGVVGLAVAYP